MKIPLRWDFFLENKNKMNNLDMTKNVNYENIA